MALDSQPLLVKGMPEEPREPWRSANGFVDDALYYWEGQQRYEHLLANGQVGAANEVAAMYNLTHQQELSGFTLESFARDYDAARLEDGARAAKTLLGDHNMKTFPVTFSAVMEHVRAEMAADPETKPRDEYVESIKARLFIERIKDFSDQEVDRCLQATVSPVANMRVLAFLVVKGMTVEQIYEGMPVSCDDVFNTLVQMGQDASLEAASLLSGAMTAEEACRFHLAPGVEEQKAVVAEVGRRAAERLSAATSVAPASDHVIRYVVTVPCKDGLGRTLFSPCQGRHTHATPEEAQAWIDAYLKNNSEAILDQFGRDLQVRPCKCYPGHFDPMGVYFDTPEDPHELLKAVKASRESDDPSP